MSEPRVRRSSDHPYEARVRVVLAVVFGLAAVWFGVHDQTVPMGVFLVACGAMMKIDIGKALPK